MVWEVSTRILFDFEAFKISRLYQFSIISFWLLISGSQAHQNRILLNLNPLYPSTLWVNPCKIYLSMVSNTRNKTNSIFTSKQHQSTAWSSSKESGTNGVLFPTALKNIRANGIIHRIHLMYCHWELRCSIFRFYSVDKRAVSGVRSLFEWALVRPGVEINPRICINWRRLNVWDLWMFSGREGAFSRWWASPMWWKKGY